MSGLVVVARAKINLTLEVVRRLPSGYHELRTVFQQVQLCDELTFADGAGSDIALSCDHAGLVLDQTNLVWRAADLMRRRFRPDAGISIRLRKRIPIGGGLAGGSADAAATLVGMNKLWQLGLTLQELLDMAVHLGMDVPFCVLGGTALGKGRGEELTPLPSLPPTYVVIAHPGVCISTAESYALLRPEQMTDGAATEAMAEAIRRRDMAAVAAGLCNVFEANLVARVPAVGRLKAMMLESGASNASLSGSGASVFCLAGSKSQAVAIARAVRKEFPAVFVTQTC